MPAEILVLPAAELLTAGACRILCSRWLHSDVALTGLGCAGAVGILDALAGLSEVFLAGLGLDPAGLQPNSC